MLGAVLIDPDILMRVQVIVQPEDFYHWRYRAIFEAMIEVGQGHAPADIITVIEELSRKKVLDSVGGEAIVSSLANDVPSPFHAEHYAEIVKRLSVQRELILAAQEIGNLASEPDADWRDILNLAQKKLGSVATRGGDTSTGIREILADISSGKTVHSLDPISTGLRSLDVVMGGGYRPTQLITVGGRTSVGKTTFLINLMAAAAGTGKTVAFFSLEMDKYEIGEKLTALRTLETPAVIRAGEKGEPVDPYRFSREYGILSEQRIFINDFTTQPRLGSLIAEARSLKYRHGLDVLYVDYAQLIDATNGKDVSRVGEVTATTRAMKLLAKELSIPVVMGAQLRRIEPNPRTGHIRKPLLSDFRESGSIEQDSDICILLSVDEMSGNQVLVDIQKNRSGPIGEKLLDFRRDISLFKETAYG